MATPKLRFKEFDTSWERKSLGDITSKIGSGSTPRGGSKAYTEDGVIFIRSQNVNNNQLILGCVDIYRIIDNHSVMTRLTLSDAQWAKIAPYCAGKETDVGRTAVNNRLFIEAVLWIVRTGSPWRDLPPEFGNWNSVYKRYRRWVKSDRFSKLFNALNDSDLEYAMIDGTIVKVHRHGQGAKGGLVIRQLANQEAV